MSCEDSTLKGFLRGRLLQSVLERLEAASNKELRELLSRIVRRDIENLSEIIGPVEAQAIFEEIVAEIECALEDDLSAVADLSEEFDGSSLPAESE